MFMWSFWGLTNGLLQVSKGKVVWLGVGVGAVVSKHPGGSEESDRCDSGIPAARPDVTAVVLYLDRPGLRTHGQHPDSERVLS